MGKTSEKYWIRVDSWKHPHERGEDGTIDWSLEYLMRNTPTSVGKTGTLAVGEQRIEKHPHERGEDMELLLVSGTV